MPKLVITKFEGTSQDWIRFWGQFETQIDKSSAPKVTKFSYLKELMVLKVQNLINGLLFTAEGYQKLKIYLSDARAKPVKLKELMFGAYSSCLQSKRGM